MKSGKSYFPCIKQKKISKTVYNNIMISLKLQRKLDAIFMNSEKSKTSDPRKLLLNLTDKINLKSSDKYVALSNHSIQYTWKNIKKSYKYNKFKISVPTWNEEFELPDGSYSVSDIQDYFKYNFKKNEAVTDSPSIRIYINKIEKRIIFEIKTRYYFELLTPEIMKLLGSTKSKATKYENGENVPHVEINGAVLDIVILLTTIINMIQESCKI